MPRHLAIDRPKTQPATTKAGSLRRLWRLFSAVALDRRDLQRLSAHELRDIGLPDRTARDRFRDLP